MTTFRDGDVMTVSRRTIAAGLAAWPMLGSASAQQAWPSGTIRLLVPFPPGGSTDAMARLAQPGLERALGVPVIIENRPGAAGSVGAGAVARAAPDGNTWLIVFDTHAVNPALIPNMPFDSVRDLDPVALIGTAPMVVAVHPSQPYRTLADLITAARARPGAISYGTIGNGSLGHLAMTLLGRQAGITMTHVPYRGGGPLSNDAVAGHVPVSIASSALYASHLAAGTLRPLAQTGATRVATLREVPTVAESGFAGFSADAWWGVFAPARTPQPTVERFFAALQGALREERTLRTLVDTQQVTIALNGPQELRTFFAAQMEQWGRVVRENDIKPD